MNIAWNPPGLSSAIDRLMDLWDENVSVPMRRANAAPPPQGEPPAEAPASDIADNRERHDQQVAAAQGRISAMAALAGG